MTKEDKPYLQHDSDCSTNNRGVPELLGPCDCSVTAPQEAAARDERAVQESWTHGQIENAAFHKWWEESGQGTEPRHTLLVQNCAHAAWQARAALEAKQQALIDAVIHLASEASGYTISEANLREASYKWLAAQV